MTAEVDPPPAKRPGRLIAASAVCMLIAAPMCGSAPYPDPIGGILYNVALVLALLGLRSAEPRMKAGAQAWLAVVSVGWFVSCNMASGGQTWWPPGSYEERSVSARIRAVGYAARSEPGQPPLGAAAMRERVPKQYTKQGGLTVIVGDIGKDPWTYGPVGAGCPQGLLVLPDRPGSWKTKEEAIAHPEDLGVAGGPAFAGGLVYLRLTGGKWVAVRDRQQGEVRAFHEYVVGHFGPGGEAWHRVGGE